MAKTKNKNRSEVEYLRGLVRRLKSRVKYYQRRAHMYEDSLLDEDHEEFFEAIESDDKCLKCGQRDLEIIDLKHVMLEVCNSCGEKSKL